MMILRFKRISNTHHQLEYVRADGSGETTELESKNFLPHDFLHYCVETEGNQAGGFFGLLEKGYSYADLSGKSGKAVDAPIAMDVERTVGAATAITRGQFEAENVLAGMRNMYDAYKEPLPAWVTADLLRRVAERYRQVLGHWNSLKFGETLELPFEA